MEDIFLFIVVLMFILAVADLIVGVSNDAVNFLNSAIGSNAARRRTIMIVASLGIIVGATFSSGMMEVARKGIFNPEYFAINEIMILFCAVMLTDILLLDFFNTISLPTSTTVSIVFELFGAAVILAILKTVETGGGLPEVMQYINTSRALLIIFGIFISVIIAFFIGWMVQYITRMLVSFNYRRRMKIWGGVIGGISIGTIALFILFKGIKGASFLSGDTIEWIHSNALRLSLFTIIVSGIVIQILIVAFNFNIFRFITMLGTFALAMAFASNDLVNFIGVPVATLQSYTIWSNSGLPAEGFMMEALAEPLKTNPWYLLGAGMVMMLTLWFSKKARSVTATTINLSRQSEGYERFKANEFSRAIVGTGMRFSDFVNRFTPKQFRSAIAKQFDSNVQVAPLQKDEEAPAFDLVRAAISLVIASLLISIGTSLKLPLSTTYVSFMVAMGTSLADRAWGRDSAVYRVSGVFTIIGGWFSTAIIAFLVSGFFALLMWYFGGWALGLLVILAAYAIIQSTKWHSKKAKLAEEEVEVREWYEEQLDGINLKIKEKLVKRFDFILDVYENVISYLAEEKRNKLRKLRDSLNKNIQKHFLREAKYSYDLKELSEDQFNTGRLVLISTNLETRLLNSLVNIVNACEIHVNNLHEPLQKSQLENVNSLIHVIENYFNKIVEMFDLENITDEMYDKLTIEKDKEITKIEDLLKDHISKMRKENLSSKGSQLYITILMETKDLISVATKYIKLYRKTHQTLAPNYMVEIAEK